MSTHPPIANRVACIDFDGTIVPWGPLMAPKEPFPDVPDAIRHLKSLGFKIVIFTSRMSGTWLQADHQQIADQYRYVADLLDRYNIPFDSITAEKVPAEVYFDDRAVRVSTDFPLPLAINRWLFSQEVDAA